MISAAYLLGVIRPDGCSAMLHGKRKHFTPSLTPHNTPFPSQRPHIPGIQLQGWSNEHNAFLSLPSNQM